MPLRASVACEVRPVEAPEFFGCLLLSAACAGLHVVDGRCRLKCTSWRCSVVVCFESGIRGYRTVDGFSRTAAGLVTRFFTKKVGAHHGMTPRQAARRDSRPRVGSGKLHVSNNGSVANFSQNVFFTISSAYHRLFASCYETKETEKHSRKSMLSLCLARRLLIPGGVMRRDSLSVLTTCR